MSQRLDPFNLRGERWPPAGWGKEPRTKAERASNARRQRRYRARQRAGDVVYEVLAKEHDVASALVGVGWLSAEAALDRRRVEAALSAMLSDWASAWRK